MITTLRKKLGTGVVLGVLAIGLIAIVITGFGTGGMGGINSGSGSGGASGTTLVGIGGDKVTDSEFRQRIDGIFRQATRQSPNVDRAQWMEANFEPLLEGIIADRSLVAFARQQGFVVPDSLIAREIVAIPAFQNAAGQFDETAFRRALSESQITEQALRQDIEYSQLIRMVAAPVSGGAFLPQGVASEFANLLLERRTGSLGAIPTALLSRGINPSDDEVARFYQQNQRSFALPERRVIRYILLGREQFGDAVRATDQEIQAYYQQHQAQYGPAETRNVQLFTTQDEAAARNFAQAVSRGTSFEDASRSAGFAPEDVNLNALTKDQVTQRSDANFANAVFAAQPNALVGPQRTETGFQVARVTAVNHNPGRALETVRAEIVTAIEQAKLTERLNAAVERIQQRLDDGATIDEISQTEHLPIVDSPPVSATGAGANNVQFPHELAPILQAAFDMGEGEDAQLAVVEPDRSAALVGVGRILASAAPPLAEIHDQARARLVQQIAAQRARQIAEGIVGRLNSGMAPAQAFAQAGVAGLPAPQVVNLQRVQISRAGQSVPPPLRLLFTLPEHRAHALPAPGGAGWVVVYHQQRTAGNARSDPQGAQILQVTQQSIQQTGEEELRLQFAHAAGAALGISRNEEGINALRQGLRTTGR
jgi:peptidyl-prolyl cis-trans isomerase D